MMRLFVLLLIPALFACAEPKQETAEKSPAFDHENFELVDPWTRPAAQGSNTAGYLLIENGLAEADTLLNAYSDIAAKVEIHESYEAEEGIMGMRRIQNIIIETGDTAVLKPGGKHIMFLGLSENVSIGDTVSIDLEFAKAGLVKIKAPVRSPS